MENNEEKQIDRLIDKMMKDVLHEAPSPDFTARVMAQALASDKRATLYRPVISTHLWAILFIGFALLVAFLFTGTPEKDGASLRFTSYFKDAPNLLPQFKFSMVTVYAFISLMVMTGIQILVIKKCLWKRLGPNFPLR